jgi:hypothetical protein
MIVDKTLSCCSDLERLALPKVVVSETASPLGEDEPLRLAKTPSDISVN